MRKYRAFMTLESCLYVFFALWLIIAALALFKQGVLLTDAVLDQLELERAATVLRCRLEHFFRYQGETCSVDGKGGLVLWAKGRKQQLRLYKARSPSTNRQTLYAAVRKPGSQAGINPLVPSHLEVVYLSWTLLPDRKVACRIVLRLHAGKRTKKIQEVFRYGLW
jgi:hypothetical protein